MMLRAVKRRAKYVTFSKGTGRIFPLRFVISNFAIETSDQRRRAKRYDLQQMKAPRLAARRGRGPGAGMVQQNLRPSNLDGHGAQAEDTGQHCDGGRCSRCCLKGGIARARCSRCMQMETCTEEHRLASLIVGA